MPRSCSACGAALGDSDKWCAACGAKAAEAAAGHSTPAAGVPAATPPLQPAPVYSTPPPQPPPSYAAIPGARPARRSTPSRTVLALGVVAVIVAGVVGYGVVLQGGPGSASPTAQTLDGIVDSSNLVPPNPPDVAAAPADERTTPITGQLSVGDSAPLASQTIGTSGGTIQATGLTIKFPARTLTADASIAVSAAPITDQTFGGFITPLTPLYHVDDGGAELNVPVAVTLAAQIPNGATAMAFYYDQASGELTPLMPDSQDASGMTVGATHFSDLFGALIDLQKIPTTVDSGFRVKKDDWQFPNEGSYIEPDGQCAGKVESEIWYYADKHLRGSDTDHLYGQFDNNGSLTATPDFWQDDSGAYRLTAAVQVEPWANEFAGDAYRTAKNNPDDRFTYAALRSAIALSGQPQYLSVATADDTGKHAIAVYRVEPNRLFVADPNFPGVVRTITYDPATGKLGPYLSGISTDAIAVAGFSSYTRFAYVPWRSNVSESTMAGEWAKLQAGIAGDDLFPKYQLYARPAGAPGNDLASWSPLSDGQTTSEPQLVIAVAATGSMPGKSGGPALKIQSGAPSSPLGALMYGQTVTLGEGTNSLGVLELGPRPGTNAAGHPITTWNYVDFVRLTIVRTSTGGSGDWKLAGVTVGQPNVTIHNNFSVKGDGRGGLTAIWESNVFLLPDGSPRTAQGDFTWQIPDRLTPGTQASVTLGVKMTQDEANCLFKTASVSAWVEGATESFVTAAATCGAGDPATGSTATGSFLVPAEDPTGSGTLDFTLYVSEGDNTVAVTYSYKK